MDSLGRELLDQVYFHFSDKSADLFDAVSTPPIGTEADHSAEHWTDLGDWLGLAERLGAEKVLFVRSDPVAVFTDARQTPDEAALGELYRRAWCLSEPRCLFVALPHELRVYDLNLPPQRGAPPSEPWRTLSTVADVLELTRDIEAYGPALQGLMEIGASGPARADRRLIEDLRHVRTQLQATGLSMAEAHALIGRSILVRYLEDRGVLTKTYFERVAVGHRAWQDLLDDEGHIPIFGPSNRLRFYDRVLRDAEFTHALFVKLAADFNGDLFELGDARETKFGAAALGLLRSFLLGDIQAGQQPLFFWAYDFEVVPLALISSIYEQFYHDALVKSTEVPASLSEGEDHQAWQDTDQPASLNDTLKHGAGTHYTPANLVQDVLRRTLTPANLALNPKILDPACGSGIFLVEAFRRIVRFEAQRQGCKLSPQELRNILKERVFGVEINAEASRVAAFSLYLALLDQQEPPDIASGGPLPHLIHTGTRDDSHFGILIVSDAFAITSHERNIVTTRVQSQKAYKGRASDMRLLEDSNTLDLQHGTFDVVIGNPPWQEAPSDNSLPRNWAAAFNLPVGEGSYSQLFIHRALTLLREGGTLGLLISMKIFWNDRETSRDFRRYLLGRAALKQIVNMAHVRRVFFAKAVAPFAFLLVENRSPTPNERVVIWNARRVGSIDRLRSMAAVPLDRRLVAQYDLAAADYLWKVFWWGGHNDAALISRLALERTLEETVREADPQPHYGWQRGSKAPSGHLAELPELNNKKVQPFGPLEDSWFLPPPTGIKRDPDQRIYSGQRLIITRGVREPIGPVARLETRGFSFRHAFYCIPLSHLSEAEAKMLLGVLWSSLGRYVLFMTAGSWGGWHDQVTARDLLRLPIRLKASWGMPKREHDEAADRVIQAVTALRERANQVPTTPSLFDEETVVSPNWQWQRQLDKAIFDLFELSSLERSLIEDFWEVSHDLYWKGADANAIRRLLLPASAKGTGADSSMDSVCNLQRYLRTFISDWRAHLPDGADFHWQVVTSPGRDAIAVIFTLAHNNAKPEIEDDWQSIISHCAKALNQEVSPAFHIRRSVRVVAADQFIVLRDNAARFWTESAAHEDAEALFVQLATIRPQD